MILPWLMFGTLKSLKKDFIIFGNHFLGNKDYF